MSQMVSVTPSATATNPDSTTGTTYQARIGAVIQVPDSHAAILTQHGWLRVADYDTLQRVNSASEGSMYASGGFTLGGAYNFSRSNTNNWRKARGNVQSNTQNAKLLCIGNSITAGYNATGATNGGNLATKAYPTILSQVLSARGLTASWQSWIGGQNYANFNAADSRIVMGSWTNAGLGTFGGNAMQLATTGQTLMSFTPTTQVDTVEVLALRNNNTAITIAVDGGATLFTYNAFASGSGKIGTSGAHTLGALASHAIQANISSATSTYMVGMVAYNSAVKEVSVLRAGWQGALAADIGNPANSWPYLDGIKTVAPDLTLIALTRNDPTSATDLNTFRTYYQNAVDAAQISGDVILVIEPLGALGSGAPASAYIDTIYNIATQSKCGVIDFTQLWDNYSTISGWYSDGTHPIGMGYSEMARQIAEILLAL